MAIADLDISEDVHKIFQELTGMGKAANVNSYHTPFTLHTQLMSFIDDEIANAKAGRRRILLLNVMLTERHLIDKLYDASQAGVKIDYLTLNDCIRLQVKACLKTLLCALWWAFEHTRVYYS